MHIIFVTEIWGKTPHVDSMVSFYQETAESVTVVDPYDGTDPAFTSEEEAYQKYSAVCGHEAYAKRVVEAVKQAQEPVYLVGFSAGAGAVWSACCAELSEHIHGALCFYGSSIRTMTDSTPKVPVELIFSDNEESFDVESVARKLQDYPLAQCYITPFAHGFMNPLSANFHQEAYNFWLTWIRDQLMELSSKKN